MVGDSWERDIEGAGRGGLPLVWIASGRPVPARQEGVTVIETIGELAECCPGCRVRRPARGGPSAAHRAPQTSGDRLSRLRAPAPGRP